MAIGVHENAILSGKRHCICCICVIEFVKSTRNEWVSLMCARQLYSEDPSTANELREQYRKGIWKIIEMRSDELTKLRLRRGREIPTRRDAFRNELRRMLGWPLTEPVRHVGAVRETVLSNSDVACVSRIECEIFPGFWFYGVLMRHKDDVLHPLVVVQHGAAGTPELCLSFYPSGNYNDMALRVYMQGANVFAPQLLLWKEGEFGRDTERLTVENELRRLGGSIAALEIYCIQCCLDVLERMDGLASGFGMVGLSYGGFYTLYTAACDTRIQAALDCSFFTDRQRCYGGDFAWHDSMSRFSDAEVGALVCPRALYVAYGDADSGKCVLGAKVEFSRLKEYYSEAPANLRLDIFHGTHEFCPEDDGICWTLSKIHA